MANGTIGAHGDPGKDNDALRLHRMHDDEITGPEWALNVGPLDHPGLLIKDARGYERLLIDQNSGRVGIGTMTPGEQAIGQQGRHKSSHTL